MIPIIPISVFPQHAYNSTNQFSAVCNAPSSVCNVLIRVEFISSVQILIQWH